MFISKFITFALNLDPLLRLFLNALKKNEKEGDSARNQKP